MSSAAPLSRLFLPKGLYCICHHVCVHKQRLVTSHYPLAVLCRVMSGLNLQLLPACLVLRQF